VAGGGEALLDAVARHQAAEVAGGQQLGHLVRHLGVAAGHAAQVDGQLVVLGLGELAELLLHVVHRLGPEARHAQHGQVAHALQRGRRLRRFLHREAQRLALALADDREGQRRAALLGHALLDLPDLQLARRLAVDLGDEVAALEAGLLGGALRGHAGDVDPAALAHQEEAGVGRRLAARGAELRHLIGGDVDRERAQRVGRALVGAGHQVRHIGVLDVGLAHQTEHLGEDREVLVERVRLGGLGAGLGSEPRGCREHDRHQGGDGEEAGAIAGHRVRGAPRAG
jgi:hypothetical protein